MSDEDILIALKEIHARYCIPACEQNYTDKDYACMQYEKLVLHLRTQLQQKENIIKELEKVLDRNIELNYYKNNVRQYNKTLTEGAIMYRDYIKEKLRELKGNGSNDSKRDV